jgi:hypothetical protein
MEMGRLRFGVSLGKNVSKPPTQNIRSRVMLRAYNPGYTEGIDRRITVQSQLWAKT